MKDRPFLTNLACFFGEETKRMAAVRQIDLCYPDLNRAFDPVNQYLILITLDSPGVRRQTYHGMETFPNQRAFYVEMRDRPLAKLNVAGM